MTWQPVNHAEPGDYELDDGQGNQYDHDYDLDGDEHVDGCGCDAGRVMWVQHSDESSLLTQHKAFWHHWKPEPGCPVRESYSVEETREPYADQYGDDVPLQRQEHHGSAVADG